MAGGMMHLPNADRTIVDRMKFEAYCLSPTHPRGRHKAKAFKSRPDIGPAGAGWLQGAILDAVRRFEAVAEGEDAYGRRFRVDMALERRARRAMTRTLRIIRRGETTARLITRYVP
jgi:hypothetical protein